MKPNVHTTGDTSASTVDSQFLDLMVIKEGQQNLKTDLTVVQLEIYTILDSSRQHVQDCNNPIQSFSLT